MYPSYLLNIWSLPTGERGLKLLLKVLFRIMCTVAPYRGAWIEITWDKVPPHGETSLPTGERGLKCCDVVTPILPERVAPYRGAWIEIKTACRTR